MSDVVLNIAPLETIKKALKDNYKTRVGILSGEGSKEVGDINMATLGAIHEFGALSMNIPARSFLRKPLEDHIFEWVKKNGEHYEEQMEKGNLKKWYVALGSGAEEIVDNAFTSSGDGNWAPNAPITVSGGWMHNPVTGGLFYVEGKGSSKPLMDTGALRGSIASKVIENDK